MVRRRTAGQIRCTQPSPSGAAAPTRVRPLLPFTTGALFYAGDLHLAMGDGEVALIALEGSLRTTYRLTVVKKGAKGAPSIAFGCPFAETPRAWVPIGLSEEPPPTPEI